MTGFGFRNSVLPSGRLYDHQLDGSVFLNDIGLGVLAHDVGLGKTATVAVFLDDLSYSGKLGGSGSVRHPYLRCALWITPASLVRQTVAALRTLLPRAGVEPFDFKRGQPRPPADIIVTSMEGLKFRRWVFGLVHGVVVVDECSRLKHRNPTYDAVLAMTSNADRVVGMTATPFENDAMESFNMLSAMGLLLPTEQSYVRDFVDWTVRPQWEKGHAIGGASKGFRAARLPQLRRQIHPQLHVATAESAGIHLPEVITYVHDIELTGAQAAAYVGAERFGQGLARHQRQQRATEYVGDESVKVDMADLLIRENRGRKIVVWCERKHLLELLGRQLTARGVGWVTVTGDHTQTERGRAVARFRDDPSTCVLLGSGALEYGIDGLQISDCLISMGITWNPAREAQRVGRLRRVGSRHNVIEHHQIVTATDHEDHKRQRLDEKQMAGEQLFGGMQQKPMRMAA